MEIEREMIPGSPTGTSRPHEGQAAQSGYLRWTTQAHGLGSGRYSISSRFELYCAIKSCFVWAVVLKGLNYGGVCVFHEPLRKYETKHLCDSRSDLDS